MQGARVLFAYVATIRRRGSSFADDPVFDAVRSSLANSIAERTTVGQRQLETVSPDDRATTELDAIRHVHEFLRPVLYVGVVVNVLQLPEQLDVEAAIGEIGGDGIRSRADLSVVLPFRS